jgi:hypothetical protein
MSSRYCQLAASFNANQAIMAGKTPVVFTATASVKENPFQKTRQLRRRSPCAEITRHPKAMSKPAVKLRYRDMADAAGDGEPKAPNRKTVQPHA